MRLPAVTTLKNRAATTNKDGRMLNAFAESKGGVMRAVKRPSTIATFEALEGGSGLGQGLFGFSTPTGSDFFGIQNDVLTTFSSMTSIATRLVFTTQPVDWKIDTAFSPSIVVKAQNSFGTVISTFSGSVTLSFEDNPNGGTLSGTLTVTMVAGVATFSNVKIDKVGGNYRLRADSPTIFGSGRNCISSTFKIVSALSFTAQPTSTVPNDPIVCEVTVVDSSGNAITGYTGNITVSLAVNLVGATLSGTLTKAAVSGAASFIDLSINLASTYILKAEESDGNLLDVNSNSFEILDPTHTLTSVENPFSPGEFGFNNGVMGSISPATFDSQTIENLLSGATYTAFSFASVQPVDFFTSITISGTTLLASAASYSVGVWTWNGVSLITGAGSYSIAIVK